jgi:hypothetical protein
VFGKIVRGELWEALDGIHTIRRDAFLPTLDWTAGRPHDGYRRLETKLDPEMAERLTGTLAPLEAGRSTKRCRPRSRFIVTCASRSSNSAV